MDDALILPDTALTRSRIVFNGTLRPGDLERLEDVARR
jgi:hypothetical protein